MTVVPYKKLAIHVIDGNRPMGPYITCTYSFVTHTLLFDGFVTPKYDFPNFN